MPRSRRKPNLWAHLLIFFTCVGFPAILTALAPVCEMRFSRVDGAVTAVVQTKLFFLIPYHIERVEGVKELEEHYFNPPTKTGTLEDNPKVRRDDKGFLVIRGRSGEITLEVSPLNLADVQAKARAFLADPGQSKLRLLTVANWKMGVFAGGAFSLLTLLYIIGLLSWIWARLTGRPRPAKQAPKELPHGNASRLRK